jgi:hypothetical protein
MTTKHTPGPWKAVYVGCGDWDLTGPVTQEDWTLAAAAPDLLEALNRVMPFIDCIAAVTREEIIEYEAAMKMADAVIKKATGQE